MRPENMVEVERNKTLISVIELKRLLIELRDKRSNACIRYRLMGEMWMQNFFRIIHVTEKGVVLNDEVLDRITVIHDLSMIMQFEIDTPFQGYQPYFHYEVSGLIHTDAEIKAS
jgi:hypothetical protein